MTVNVMITGMGQVLGIGILKALKKSSLNCKIIGTDCEPRSAGLYMVDKSYIMPNAVNSRTEYIQQMSDICKKEKIDIVFLGSEPEMMVFAPIAQEFFKEVGTFTMVNPASVLNRATDKWLTHLFLSAHGFPEPGTILLEDEKVDEFCRKYKFPLLIKPRQGSASKGIEIIENNEQLRYFSQLNNAKNLILQEYIKPDNEEYTVGVFLTESGNSHSAIVMRRELSAGLTFRAEVVNDEEISSLSREVAEKSGVIGPCNIQIRKSNSGPVILEINPRFSSTVPIRAHFGFNEPAMVIERFLFSKTPTVPKIKTGVAMRYWEEKYIESAGDNYVQ